MTRWDEAQAGERPLSIYSLARMYNLYTYIQCVVRVHIFTGGGEGGLPLNKNEDVLRRPKNLSD